MILYEIAYFIVFIIIVLDKKNLNKKLNLIFIDKIGESKIVSRALENE